MLMCCKTLHIQTNFSRFSLCILAWRTPWTAHKAVKNEFPAESRAASGNTATALKRLIAAHQKFEIVDRSTASQEKRQITKGGVFFAQIYGNFYGNRMDASSGNNTSNGKPLKCNQNVQVYLRVR